MLSVLVLILVGAVIYSTSLNVPFVLDDNFSIDFIGRKGLLENISHGSSRRIADITFALNYRIHGLQVMGYHLTNLAIHLSTSILLYFTVVSIISALRVSYPAKLPADSLVDQYIPFAMALLFVSHPVQTQAVTYIIQRYTSLATLFYLLSTLSFIRARLAFDRSGKSWKSWLYGACALLAGLLAVGSKQIAFTLPCMLLMMEIYLFQGRLLNRRFLVASGVIFAIILASVIYAWHGNSLDEFLFDLNHGTSEDQYTPRLTYFLTQTRVVVTYLRLLCLPFGQNLMHDAPIYTSILSILVVASLSLHVLLIASAIILYRKSGQNLRDNDWCSGVFQRLASLGIIWFYISMAVESSVFPIRDTIFEHRIYLPSIGYFMSIVAITALAVQGRRTGLKVAWAMLLIASILLGSMTIARNHIWNDTLALWQDTVIKSPNKWLATASLANEYMARKMPAKALPLYVRTMELHPSVHITIISGLGDALKALNLYGSRFTTGEEFILPGGVLDSGSLDYRNMAKSDGVRYNNLGLAYEYLNEPEKALRAYREAITVNPLYDLAWYNQALIAARLGDRKLVDESRRQLQNINPILAKAVN
jgi:tetratricopeptide (TPR) repeat protein